MINSRGSVRRLEIGGGKGTMQTMICDHLIHPSWTIEMVRVELSRLGGAQRGENACRIPGKDGTVRHVGQVCHRKRSRPHGAREVVVVRRRFSRDPGLAAMRIDIDRDGLAQNVERNRGRLAAWAAAVPPRAPTSPASIALTEVSAAPHVQCRGARACP